MKYFILVRLLDILTTLYGMKQGQTELNPYNKWLLSNGVLYFISWNLLIVLVISYIYKYRSVKVAVNIFTILNVLVVLMNIVLILLVLFKI